ncbi:MULTISPECIES: transcription initiation factor IIB family protein [Halobacteriales]|uniref:Transcription initiation factor IIB n=1 Tax=Halarchaeum rubridurum TaxID=489911 RepID=A0A830G423_9EURY|nr:MULTISPECIES: transcription initiation factor IIB family protein [Halobacteriales]MBP1955668.1 transcription initiation factor TFIIB [Halarchaeum rubridurum]MCG1004643.1 transcription initiation factor IIB family protein [Halobacterium noricense]GGM74288.1 transcription initiation factor IIB [Halarchaeum rubridurum]
MTTSEPYERAFDEDIQRGTTEPCPECGGPVRTNSAETVCADCGLIIDEQSIDRGPEWHRDDADTAKRTGAPLTPARHDRGLSTVIGSGQDATGTDLSGQKRRRLARMRREQSRARWRSKQERNLGHGLTEIRRIASALGLADSVRDQACQLFRTAQNERLLKGRSIEAMAAASVFGACRCNGESWLIDDVAPMAQVGQNRVENAYTVLNEELGLPTPPVSLDQFVPRLASDLGCTDVVRRRAEELVVQAVDAGITTGVHPSGFAAACLYMAACVHDAPLTQADAAAAAGVTVETIRSHRDRLLSIVE